MSGDTTPTTVIIGGGIIGLSTAYYLTLLSPQPQTKRTVHIIESAPELFSSASGRAAGFLARDWFGSATTPLGALSFDLHRSLADAHDGRVEWGYAGSVGLSLRSGGGKEGGEGAQRRGEDWLFAGTSRAEAAAAGGERKVRFASEEDEGWPAWLRMREGDRCEVMSESGTTGQVDPLRLCQWLLEQCQVQGVTLHHPATPTGLITNEAGSITAIELASSYNDTHRTQVPCDQLVIAAGAWTSRVFAHLFPDAPPHAKDAIKISPLSGHALVVQSARWAAQQQQQASKIQDNTNASSSNEVECHAVFTTDPAGFSPEIFSRIRNAGDGEIWLGGLNSTTLPLPELAGTDTPDAPSIATLMASARKLLGNAETEGTRPEWTVERATLCHRPVTPSGVPLLDRVPDALLGAGVKSAGGEGGGGVWVCAGHGPWGISLSLGSGKVLAEMLCGEAPSVDVSGLRIRGV